MPTAQRATRGASPLLLLLAALCFLLPFVGVSCNSSAARSALGPALQSLGGSGADAAKAQQCLDALSDRDLATYSGVNLAFGGAPSTSGNVPGCDTSTSGSSTAGDQGNVGVQPLLLAAFILIVLGALATLVRGWRRHAVAGGAAVVALVLVIINNGSVHSAIASKLDSSSGGGSLASAGIGASVDSFFTIHAAIGFTLVLVALGMAIAVNALGLMTGLGVRLRLSRAGPPEPQPAGVAPPPGEPPPPGQPPPEPPPAT